jgi:hypothetical protein
MDGVARCWTNGKKKPAISNGFCSSWNFLGLCLGGDEGDRTPGLGVANAALSQLSYIPIRSLWKRLGSNPPPDIAPEHI